MFQRFKILTLTLLVVSLPFASFAANDFSGDSNCKANWRFENGALTTDSKGTNTLTDNNTVGTDTVNYQEGAASADFESDNTEYFDITDADLDSGFPLKSGDTNKKISVGVWIKLESLANHGNIFHKWKASGNKRSFAFRVSSDGLFRLYQGYNGGSSAESVDYTTAMSTGIWYHTGVTYDDSDKSYRIRVWDNNAGDFLDSDLTGSFANAINIESVDLIIGNNETSTNEFDGLIDELVVFDDILTVGEIDEIRAGTYDAGGATTSIIHIMNQ
jgi:hypothetical protein